MNRVIRLVVIKRHRFKVEHTIMCYANSIHVNEYDNRFEMVFSCDASMIDHCLRDIKTLIASGIKMQFKIET